MDILQLISTAEIIEEYGDGYSIFEVAGGIGKTYTKKNLNYLSGTDNNNALSFFITFEAPAATGGILHEFTDPSTSINQDYFQIYLLNSTTLTTTSVWPGQSINTTTNISVAHTQGTKYSLGYSLRWGKDINVYLYNHTSGVISTYYSATTIIKPATQREIIKIGLTLGTWGPIPKLYRYYMWDKPISWNQFDLIRKSV